MRVIACCKAVPEERDIAVEKDRQISLEKAERKFGQYDLNAVEAGRQIVAAAGGTLSGLCAGGKVLEHTKLRKDILSRGLSDLYLVVDDALEGADAYQTARALKAAVERIGGFDLILCGAGSSDMYAQQVGNQLGELLGVPVVNSINKITPKGNAVVVERILEDAVEVLEITLPAVLSVTSEINAPRIPGMKDILAANKKPVTKFTLGELGAADLRPSGSVLSVLAPARMERRQQVIEGESDEAADAFVKLLKDALTE